MLEINNHHHMLIIQSLHQNIIKKVYLHFVHHHHRNNPTSIIHLRGHSQQARIKKYYSFFFSLCNISYSIAYNTSIAYTNCNSSYCQTKSSNILAFNRMFFDFFKRKISFINNLLCIVMSYEQFFLCNLFKKIGCFCSIN